MSLIKKLYISIYILMSDSDDSKKGINKNYNKLKEEIQDVKEQLNNIQSRFDTLNRDLDTNFQYTNNKIDDLKIHFHRVYKELLLKMGELSVGNEAKLRFKLSEGEKP